MSTENHKADTQAQVDDEMRAAETAEPTSEAATDVSYEQQVAKLSDELSKALEMVENHKDQAIRAHAESENVRRRAEREIANASKFALERFAREILAVVDSLEKALEHPVEGEAQVAMHEGIDLTYKLLIDILNKFHVEQISPLGKTFDPGLHEAMVMQESADHEPNSVMHVVQTGYSLHGRLLRPARVVVAKGKSPKIDEKA